MNFSSIYSLCGVHRTVFKSLSFTYSRMNYAKAAGTLPFGTVNS